MGIHKGDIVKENEQKLRDQERDNDGYNKLWDKHQSNEYTKINKYKEGYCWLCLKRDFVFATLIDACKKCKDKKDNETKLANLPYAPGMDGFCSVCGFWEWGTSQINVRLCHSCMNVIQRRVRDYVKKGKANGHPMYNHFRRKFGKDWNLLLMQPEKLRI